MNAWAALTTRVHNAGTAAMVKGTTWVLRIVAFVVVAVIALDGHAVHRVLVVVVLVVVGALLLVWAGTDLATSRSRPLPMWVLMVVLGAMGAAAGTVTALPVADAIVAFTVVAAVGAGSELPTAQACAVAATSIFTIEISYLAFGFGSGDIGWPLTVVAGVLIGRQRRDARIQSAQAAALVAQAEQNRVQEQRTATLDERTRIAREIHDLLAHSLGALGIQIEAAQALLTDARDIDRAIPLLDQSRRLAASGLEETRLAIEALRTDAPPLPESLASLAEGHIQQHQTPVELAVTGAPRPLVPDANLALIRTTQEALVNAAKHAPSAPIAIRLDYGSEHTTMIVANTRPLEQEAVVASRTSVPGASGGYGLAGMRERLLLIGGTLTAGPSDRGWVVRAEVPL
jgi:signal transduction histidine kinase